MMVALNATLSAFTSVPPSSPRLPRPCGACTEVTVDTTTAADGPLAKAYVRSLDNHGPRYPFLRGAPRDGEVVATYVLDTSGRVMHNTAQITAESDRAFGESVCVFLAGAKYAPVIIEGRKRTLRVVDAHFKFSMGAP